MLTDPFGCSLRKECNCRSLCLHHSNKRAEVCFCSGGAAEAAGGGLTARMQLLIWKSVQSAPRLFIYFCLFEAGRPFSCQQPRGSRAERIPRRPGHLPALLGSVWGGPGVGMWAQPRWALRPGHCPGYLISLWKLIQKRGPFLSDASAQPLAAELG